MRPQALILAALAGTATVAVSAFAQDLGLRQRSGAELRTGEADPNRGRFIAFGGFHGDLRISCAQCHGMDGAGNSSGAFPRINDQAGWYLYKTLMDYASGLRPSDIMGPIARTLTEQQMQDVAAYYASVKDAPHPPRPEIDVRVRQIGGAIAAAGIPSQGALACNGCHGPNGVGQPPIYPYLAGQYAPYTEHQLMLWKEGRRDGDPMNVMEQIAKAMTPEQIRAVSLYYAAVRPQDVTPSDVRLAPERGAVGGGEPSPRRIRGNPTGVGANQNPQPGQAQPAPPLGERPPYLRQPQTGDADTKTTTGTTPIPPR